MRPLLPCCFVRILRRLPTQLWFTILFQWCYRIFARMICTFEFYVHKIYVPYSLHILARIFTWRYNLHIFNRLKLLPGSCGCVKYDMKVISCDSRYGPVGRLLKLLYPFICIKHFWLLPSLEISLIITSYSYSLSYILDNRKYDLHKNSWGVLDNS